MPSICELPQGSTPGEYEPHPVQTTSPEWSVPCTTPPVPEGPSTYHSIYVNSSFVVIIPSFPHPLSLLFLR